LIVILPKYLAFSASELTMLRIDRTALVVLLATSLSFAGCSAGSPSGPSAQVPTLRITNVGSRSIEGLVVIFPDERVTFGDVPAGATTAYQAFSNGVFPYAAYQLRVDGKMITQPVIDWVGALPMTGAAFTYSIEASETPAVFANIRLVFTTRDR
jgi:hypothetical protein